MGCSGSATQSLQGRTATCYQEQQLTAVNYVRMCVGRQRNGRSATFCSCHQLPGLQYLWQAKMLELFR